MNRKKTAKTAAKMAKAETLKRSLPVVHPYDDVEQWLGADFGSAPQPESWVKEFQTRIDNAFGVPGAFVLAWSGDRKYWDEFYTDWHSNGLAKADSLERKPLLLWHTFWVNELDYIYLHAPRWVILESHHPSQFVPTWDAGVWVSDKTMLGGRKQIRTIEPPKHFYHLHQTVAQHDEPLASGAKPLCCAASAAANVICYGKYRLPNEADLDELRKMRRWMDENNIQRPDEAVSTATRRRLSSLTRYYADQARRMQSRARRDFAMFDPRLMLGKSLEERGMNLSAREVESLVAEAMDRIDEEKGQEQHEIEMRKRVSI